MSSPSDSASCNGSKPSRTAQPSIESDLAFLQNALSQEVDPSQPEDVEELLKKLEAAEGVADGMESRLDDIMDNLDRLLGDLGAHGVQADAAAGPNTANSTPDQGSVSHEDKKD